MIKVNDYIRVKDTDSHHLPIGSLGRVTTILPEQMYVIKAGILEQILHGTQFNVVKVWECSHCGEVNWSMKKKCTKCGTSKKLYQHQRK